MAKPNISTRDYIFWKGSYATEPTSTLVLTSSTSKFIDIRIFKPTNLSEPELPNEGGPMTRLEWAFAGNSRTFTIPNPINSRDPITHSIWEHWVDSNVPPDVPAAADEGDMYPQPDGRTLESGQMVNPATGTLTAYEEMWRDIPVAAIGSDNTKSSVVITIDEPAQQTRGMIIRIGQWCQGLLKIGNEVTVERWEYLPGGMKGRGSVEGDWTRCVRLGSRFLPCAMTFKPEGLVPGNKIQHGDMVWVVQEKFEWTE
ncbi:hypothetical protein K432DRAFT_227934 [Lepidopterella palustris CBS 459.81]|uniref:Protein HRI1 n=1 Tax=Lepidopterella palustris CBS 459.81 TaxID=1314670 RepID=A0A8E2EKU7_9PEZI|nr:hypothetical protein K432DRAFT_227934 [Lepidopterella palustris CBS 459.81]